MAKTVSLKMAESLEQAGFPQNSYFWWVYRRGEWMVTGTDDLSYNELALAAPTRFELLVHLRMGARIKVFDADALGEVYLQRLAND